MAQSRSFLDRSAAQKLVDSAIHRAIEFRITSARIQTAHTESIGLGAVAPDEDVNIDEIRRDALENTGRIALHEQQLLTQDDLRRQRQQMQHQLDEVLRGLNAKGTLPEVARSKDQIRAQRTACLQFLLDTNKYALEEERLKFPEHQAAAKQLGVLVASEARTEEHVLWALGSEDAMVKDYWTADELFEALVIARKVVDDVNRVKQRNAEYWEMIQEGKTPFDNLYAKLSMDLEKIVTTGQEAAKATKIIHDNLELVVTSTGSNPKRKRPSAIDTTLANTDDASVAGPSTAPITKPSLVVALRLPRSFSFSQLSRPAQIPQIDTTSTNTTASGQTTSARTSSAQLPSSISPQPPQVVVPPSPAVIAERAALGVQRLPAEIASRLGIWMQDGQYEEFDDEPLTGDALAAFYVDLKNSAWCTWSQTTFELEFNRGMRGNATCIWGRIYKSEIATLKPAKKAASRRSTRSNQVDDEGDDLEEQQSAPNSEDLSREFACANCIRNKRFCVSKLALHFNRKPVLLPLPENLRGDKEDSEVGYWKIE
ncbi:unnamed protein product [Aureobasidium uvarum]|uniref:Uncharacterized protein n=1 Tax=Aureobasidium uvarum TaxID=2773716 RepID=A0A9N8KCA5_9PEZI|nr:unnamed protein product [Aureobasidium uvarum]